MFRRALILALLVAVLVPTVAFAAPEWLPLVQCGTSTQPPCTPCFMFKTLKNTIDLILYGITGPLAAFMFVLAGGMMLVGADSVKLQAQARRLFANTVYGVAIVLAAWLGTNFLLKGIGAGDVATHWYEFECPTFLASINSGTDIPTRAEPAVAQPEPVTVLTGNLTPADLQGIAQAHHVPYPRQNSSDLQTLMTCIYNDPIIKAIAKPMPPLTGGVRQAGIYTYDNDNDYCNYTRGVPAAGGACSHSQKSCHYGGIAVRNGAEAVDMNAREVMVTLPGMTDRSGNPIQTYADEEQLFCQLNRLLVIQRKCAFKFLNWEPGKDAHTHISTKSCDSDGTGVSTFRGGKLPNCADSARFPGAQ